MAMKLNWRSRKTQVMLATAGCLAVAAPALARFGPWGAPVSAQLGSHPLLNTEFVDGCPIMSPDGLSLYMASTRPGGLGGIDIWVAKRASTSAGWHKPVNLGAPVNSAADDFCPTPATGKRLFFVSKRDEPNGDIYVSTKGPSGWSVPQTLGPNVNSLAEEWSPSVFTDQAGHETLYFSSTRGGNQDIFQSVSFGPATAVAELNTPFDDARPNVRSDGREIVFNSTRPGTLGGPDIWTASRPATNVPWRRARHLAELSSTASDSRATLSDDGSYMLFGSGREGGEGLTDIYVTRRSKTSGSSPDAD